MIKTLLAAIAPIVVRYRFAEASKNELRNDFYFHIQLKKANTAWIMSDPKAISYGIFREFQKCRRTERVGRHVTADQNIVSCLLPLLLRAVLCHAACAGVGLQN